MLDWVAVVLCHVLVVNSVVFVLEIKSVRSLGCLLNSLYFLREDVTGIYSDMLDS